MDQIQLQKSKIKPNLIQSKKIPIKPQSWNIEKAEAYKGLEEVTYHTDLSVGFKDDCEQFLLEFGNMESFSFTRFAALWRDLKFEQILQEEDVEHLVIFLENCFFQLKKYVVFSKNLFIQVGAFYMLYGIYYLQPKHDLVKIRWTYDEYNALLKLLELVQNQSEDFVFIFNKMKFSNAYLFVAETRRWGIEPKYAYEEKQLKDNIFGHDMNLPRIKSKIYSNDFYGINSLEQVHSEYQEGLQEYLNEHPEHKVTSVFHSLTLTEDLKRDYEKFELDPKHDLLEKPMVVDNTILKKRQEIKQKAVKMENIPFWSEEYHLHKKN